MIPKRRCLCTWPLRAPLADQMRRKTMHAAPQGLAFKVFNLSLSDRIRSIDQRAGL